MRLALVALIVAGCGKGATVDKPSGNGNMNKTMNKGSGATFEQGAALSPTDKLVTWLDAQQLDGKPRLIRLPIVLSRGQVGFDISNAKIGGGANALEIYANDSSMGVGLADRADDKCGDAATCAFLAEGYWRGKQAGGLQFDINKAEPLTADALAAATHAEVEGESGN
ncbi:MAG: hypothetical protein M4D80_34185 [Myxococcota bacterium]|nr:hypothetical protein [Myxococcota bacterium]